MHQMITRQDLELKNPWWKSKDYTVHEASFLKRSLYFDIVGIRRVGKSTLLRQLIAHLLESKESSKNIFYFLFDYSSQVQKPEFLEEVLSFYLAEVLNNPAMIFAEAESVYILLDEIQYIDNWQSVIKKYYDLSGKRIKFIVTGSQSMLLKGKHRESLAGRIFDFYLPPMSFREFLYINKEEVETVEPFSLTEIPQKFGTLEQFDIYSGKRLSELGPEYITTGQFPESRKLPTQASRHEYIVEAVLGKILEDCIRVFRIEKTDEFKLFTKHLLNNISSVFELSNVGREVEISKKTLEKYLGFLKESYVLDVLYKYHKSLVKRGRILKKLYTPCVNFTCALNQYDQNHLDKAPEAFGKIIENMVYNVLHAKYTGNSVQEAVSFWRQGEKEIDFLVMDNLRQIPVEVKFSNNINFKDLMPMTEYLIKKDLDFGIVVTKNELVKHAVKGKTLFYIPYYLVLFMV
jgi:uncharacterized protein